MRTVAPAPQRSPQLPPHRFPTACPHASLSGGHLADRNHRLPVIAVLDELDEEALVRILTEPKNALVKQYQRLLKLEGVDLEIRDDALSAVATRAMDRKTGARGLRSILENALLDTMFDLPSQENVKKVVVEGSVIADNVQPLLIYEDDDADHGQKRASTRP